MAFEDYDEYEQGEQVRKWIKENGIAIVVGVAIALALIFGYRKWQAHKTSHEIQAAAQFAVIQTAVQSGNKQAMTAALGDLQQNFANTPYAAFGSAAVAQFDVGKDDLKAAVQNLQWAVAHGDQEGLKSLFTLRLARVLLAQGQAQQALTTLDGIPAGDYAGPAAELRGDALLKLGKLDSARSAYQDALAKLDADMPGHAALQMKLDNLSQPAAAPTETKSK
ncbi:MAG TPA: tetratricopeptide repeat protein [Rhodanobacteraceae bacterium]|jgi:predicted negative regulator of RcsB-dependent stress response|nr:tetratricopeptide repeat protein [Rhodanobacteraceae bacterium]